MMTTATQRQDKEQEEQPDPQDEVKKINEQADAYQRMRDQMNSDCQRTQERCQRQQDQLSQRVDQLKSQADRLEQASDDIAKQVEEYDEKNMECERGEFE